MIRNPSNKLVKIYLTPTLLVAVIYIISVLIISPWGNYAVGDDYYYLTQIEAFNVGEFTKSALIGPTIILQSFIGWVWTKIFGLNYLSLRILTIMFSLASIYMMGRILDITKIKSGLKTITLLIFTFNPYFYACSLNFMSENYFLFFTLVSVYYFLLFLTEDKNIKTLVFSAILGGLSIMIRQYGFVLLFAYLFTYILRQDRSMKVKEFLLLILPFLFFGLIGIFWPKYTSEIEPKSTSVLLFFADFHDVFKKLADLKIYSYIGYFTLPFSIFYLLKINKIKKILIFLLSFPIGYEIFRLNIFGIGNLLYMEGLQARLRINVRESLFNNVPAKVLVSYLIAISLITFLVITIELFYEKLKIIYQNKNTTKLFKNVSSESLLLFFLTIGFFSVVIITEAYFDRYFINFFVFLTILTAFLVNKFKLTKTLFPYLLTFFMCLITFFIVWDYHKENKLKWEIATKMSITHNIERYKIFIDKVYASTVQMEDTNNYNGLYPDEPINYQPNCFVQEYSKQNKNNLIYITINYIENNGFISKIFPRYDIEIDSWAKNKSDDFDTSDVLLYNSEYSSPVYNLIGKRMFVRGFCIEDSLN